MAIIEKDGFDFIGDIKGNPETMLIKGQDLQNEIKYINEKNIKSIYLNHFDSKSIKNLEFLKEVNCVEKISLNDLDLPYSGLYYLNNLKFAILSIKNNSQYLDYSKFNDLEYLSIDWYPQFPILLNNKNLKELVVRGYNPKSKCLDGLAGLEKLESLEIIQSNIDSFSGIEKFIHLNKLEAHYLSKLGSLNGIEALGKKLKVLILGTCKKLSGYEYSLEKMDALEKIILSNCGGLNNLNFIDKMDNLKFFSFVNTDIKDGNLSPLKEKKLDYVGFDDKKHYSHKMKEITPSFSWDGRSKSKETK